MRRFLTLFILLAAMLPPAQAAQAAQRCFDTPGIASCIDGRLRSFWEERARLELHPENPAPYDVQSGRLGVEALAAQGRDWASMPKSSPDTPNYFAETGQAIAPE